MNICLVDLWEISGGGHTKTAVSFANIFYKNGHNVYFVSRKQNKVREMLDQNIKHFNVKSFLGIEFQLISLLKLISNDNKPDLIINFTHVGNPESVYFAKKNNVKFIWYICGKEGYKKYLKVNPIVVQSEELFENMTGTGISKAGEIYVLPARIDLEVLNRYKQRMTKEFTEQVRKKYILPEDYKIILRVARVHESYFDSIIAGADIASNLRKDGKKFIFVHVGFVQNELLNNAISNKFQELNRGHEIPVAISIGDAKEAVLYNGIADLVIGTGRTAFEAMYYGIPIMVWGKKGFAGFVNQKNIGSIAKYNFSGRNISTIDPNSILKAIETIKETLDDPKNLREIKEYYCSFIKKTMDISIAYPELCKIIENHNFVLPDRISIAKQFIRNNIFQTKNMVNKFIGFLRFK